jgi:hypothetical protein
MDRAHTGLPERELPMAVPAALLAQDDRSGLSVEDAIRKDLKSLERKIEKSGKSLEKRLKRLFGLDN